MFSTLFLLFFLTLNIFNVASENCTDFKTCGRCIGNKLNCVWCPDREFGGSRCQSREFKNKNKAWCKAFVDPVTKFNPSEKNDQFSNSATNPVQLRPQKVSFIARPGESRKFKFFYKPAKDYPLDVYFLMDNSYSMRFHMDTLIEEAEKIYASLTNLTNNVRFGAGSFVEKFALPFASRKNHKAYAFINSLSMDYDVKKFVETVKSVSTKYPTGNYDGQEATLDALMQAMVCEEINWRKAWKMIVVSTDAPYHSAGDGKFVGAYKPNDMKCHLSNSTYDTDQSLLYDYPSVNQINMIAKKNDIAIVFAVLEKVKKTYDILSQKIERSQSVQLLNTTAEKSEIVDTITNQYLRLKQSIVMNRWSVPSFIDVELDPPCHDEKHVCGVNHTNPFELDTTLTMNSCPEDNFQGKILIGPALLKDKVEVDVEILCKCECEGHGEPNSNICSRNGTYQCGICYCNSGSYGDKCECQGNSTEQLDTEKCKAKKGDTQVCSGRGVCKCGECQNCGNNYMGLYCEIAKYHCPEPQEGMCGGNGECLANSTCACYPGWTGDACTCSASKDKCTGPYSTVCNEHGSCDCGVCICTALDPTGSNYTGPFCNICEEGCDRCKELGDYVECNYNQDKAFCDKRAGNIYNREIKKLNQTEIKVHEYRKAKPCSREMEDGIVFFKYIDKQNGTLILIQKEKEPKPAADIWIAVGTSVAAILLIGIVTLVAWKILVDLHDKREYRKFAKEAVSNGFDVAENPIYRAPAININNPAYSGRM